jgi:methionyl-tRNA formyltransferase
VRTVFLGTSEFAVAVLACLAQSPHRPTLVLSRPDRPRGRGRRLAPPPVAAQARELGIRLEQPGSINDPAVRAEIAAERPEAICVCAYGALIKEPLLSYYWMVNVHPSLLPRWRGAAPIERAIISGDELTGVSIMTVTAGLDSGPLCAQSSEPIGPRDTYGSLSHRLQAIGGALLVRTLDERPPCVQQDESKATYAEKLSAADRELDPGRPARELERVVRALTPHVGAHTRLPDGTLLGVREARVVNHEDGPTAGIVCLDGARPVMGCSEGTLEFVVVQPPGRRPMSGEDFLRGRRR